MFERNDIANATFDIVTFNGTHVGFFDQEIGVFRLSNPHVQVREVVNPVGVQGAADEARETLTGIRGADPSAVLDRLDDLTSAETRESAREAFRAATDAVDSLPDRQGFGDRLADVASETDGLSLEDDALVIDFGTAGQQTDSPFGATALVVNDAVGNPFGVREALQSRAGFGGALDDLAAGVTEETADAIRQDLADVREAVIDRIENGAVDRPDSGPFFTVEQTGPLDDGVNIA